MAAPSAPTGLTASDGRYNNKVVLDWTKSATATGYRVYTRVGAVYTDVSGLLGDVATWEHTTADAPVITPGTAAASDGTSKTHVTLDLSGQSVANGTSHAYYVTAENADGESGYSNANIGFRGASVWGAETGHDKGRTVCYLNGYLYVGFQPAPAAQAQVDKINATTLVTEATWEGAGAGQFQVSSICAHGDNIVVGCHSAVPDPSDFVLVQTSDMTTLRTYPGVAAQYYARAVYSDGTNIYGVYEYANNSPYKRVMKLDPADMSEVTYWGYSAGALTCIAGDGTHAYVGDYTNPAKVYKILLSDMSLAATWEGVVDEEKQAVRIIVVGDYVLLALGTTTPTGATTATVMKINKTTMVTDTDYPKWTGGDGETDCLGLASDGTHAIVSMYTSPTKVRKVLISTMISVDPLWTGTATQGQQYSWNVAINEGFAYVTFDALPGHMARLDISTLTLMAYQWQESAADSDASYSNISGGTTVPYNDTGAPSGLGRYFKCLVDCIGASQATSSVDRGYRRVTSGMARARVLSLVLWKR